MYCRKKNIAWLLLLLLAGCVEPYLPPDISVPSGYLVIDGYIATGTEPSIIRLSRTQNLADIATPLPEANAKIHLVAETGNIYTLVEKENGVYALSDYAVRDGQKYKLRIFLNDGKEYESEYVSVRPTPAIDSISWELEQDGVQIYVNTHDPENNTRYYRWSYQETWQYTSAFESKFDYINSRLVPREEDIYTCWQSLASTNILIGSSTRLTEDVIQEQPIVFLASDSPKLGVRYSILLKQYAISKEAYEYYQKLEKNTENLGTLFDPQPSQLTGNIRCVSEPSEVVIGYFDVLSEQSKRLFIDKSQLPQWTTTTGYEACKADTVDIREVPPLPDGYIFIEKRWFYKPVTGPVRDPKAPLFVYTEGAVISPTGCVDCRLKGTNQKPDFWQ